MGKIEELQHQCSHVPEKALTTQTQTRPATPYERLGGRDVLRRIVDRFYDLMDADPTYAELRAMHAEDLTPMRESLTGFLTGWSGGPRDWFDANPGRCMMSIHKPYTIGADVAGQWSQAMGRAISDEIGGQDPEIAKAMTEVLDQLARGMVR